ncbi:MAG: radical SAM protein [Desulfobacteraceae bacterium]
MIRRILVEHGAEDYPMTRAIAERAGLPIRFISPDQDLPPGVEQDKETLRLVRFKGEFLKPCPGTTGPGYICCGYKILHVGLNCPLDCSYCILQAYVNQPSVRVFVNLPEALSEVGRTIDESPAGTIWRIGTGEFTDSLAVDPLVGWHDLLPEFFSKRRNAVLELKTKTDLVEGVIRSAFLDKLIVSWSLNTPEIASREEHGAPSISRRLRAAARCQKEGLVVGFHFDPLFYYPGWREGYQRVVEMLARYVEPSRVIWISLGAMRYMPALKEIIRRRHCRSLVLDGEFIPALDGKMRYFKPIRIELYSFLKELIEQWHPDPGLYLCMEREEVWERSLGWSPRGPQGLSSYLDDRVRKVFKDIG